MDYTELLEQIVVNQENLIRTQQGANVVFSYGIGGLTGLLVILLFVLIFGGLTK